MTPVDVALRQAVAERGPLPFGEVVDRALYDAEAGFYATVGRAGRRGDFLTSPEVGPLFGTVVARALDSWWDEAGRPDPWIVVEAGAGPGTLARAVLAAEPACASVLRYVLVERSAAQRAAHADLVASSARVESREDLPAPGGSAVVLANELLDNLPFDLFERTPDGWAEVRVDAGEGGLVEVLVPVDGGPLGALAPAARVGARVPQQHAAQAWLRAALEVAAGGRVVALDYTATTGELAGRPQDAWLRTYRRHGRGTAPLADLGAQDLTCEVCVDQLAFVAPPTEQRLQRDWLEVHGIAALVDDGRRTWRERAHLGDLAAVRARSRVTEAEALLDPAGLGGFSVLEWR